MAEGKGRASLGMATSHAGNGHEPPTALLCAGRGEPGWGGRNWSGKLELRQGREAGVGLGMQESVWRGWNWGGDAGVGVGRPE